MNIRNTDSFALQCNKYGLIRGWKPQTAKSVPKTASSKQLLHFVRKQKVQVRDAARIMGAQF